MRTTASTHLGAPGHVTSYTDLVNRETNTILGYVLRGDMDPLMFHVANMRAYSGTNSVFSDLMGSVISKYSSYFNLPLVSPTMDQLGMDMASRMAYNASGATGTITRSTSGAWTSITLNTVNGATIPVTGLDMAGAEFYGGQYIASVALGAGQQVTLPLAGQDTNLAITSMSSTISAGVPFTATVQAMDATGNGAIVTNATNVAMSLGSGTGILTGTVTGTIAAVDAVSVTLTGIVYTKAESGVSLVASATSGDTLTAGTSAVFTVGPGPDSKLIFVQGPTSAVAGAPISPPVTVQIEDAYGNATASTATVTLAIGTNAGSGTLGGTLSAAAVNGLVSFGDLSINKVGRGYTLVASVRFTHQSAEHLVRHHAGRGRDARVRAAAHIGTGGRRHLAGGHRADRGCPWQPHHQLGRREPGYRQQSGRRPALDHGKSGRGRRHRYLQRRIHR